ncbi:hypothetical protein [Acutalibacter sp. 1XD8-36]|uniref:hypothetical protein n=1 Tax=Acutalibacter sp. 1XD8-36 TaxID=2320852 RepID=UPI00141296ED|nr:hypothetical protein [Acutalibacter sp. 1XD8-36]NBJ87916.1 hypothetical protein [Acutalibacter sp. 1XD8-36]
MTRELLEDYPHICAEIQDLEREMSEPVSDTVSGSGLNFPYTQHTVSIRGVPPELAVLKAQKEAEKEEIEQFIQGLPNSKLRRIVKYRVIHGMSWEQVAAKMGHRVSVDSVKYHYYSLWKN